MRADSGHDERYEELLAAAVQVLEQGGEPALQRFLAEHAAAAGPIRDGLAHLEEMGILSPPPDISVERSQFGEFRVLRRLGVGGMGVVYAAEQTSLQRTVALKVVRPEFMSLKTARERFQREIEAIARLQHPGIVPILAVGTEGAQPWYAMEYIDGHTLEQCLERLRGQNPAKLDGNALRRGDGTGDHAVSGGSAVFAGHYWEACVRLVVQVAAAMSYVHEQGIVHRDLKPSNIVVDRQGRAMVLDFGLAHVRDLARMTVERSPLGTPAYASPEQVRGEAIDERVDIYGLGVTLYELLTTQLPFHGESLAAMQSAILAGNARSVRAWNHAVPADLAVVCAVAMDRDRARRYRSMADFAVDLEAVLTRRPIHARPLGLGLRTLRWAQRHPSWTVTIAALMLVALQFPLVLWRMQADANAQLAQANGDLAQVNRELASASQRVQEAHGKAVQAAAEARRQTTRLHVAEANRRLGDGDCLGALPPLVAALRGADGDVDVREHATRLAAALRQCPQVVHHWTLPAWRDRRDASLTYLGHSYGAEWSPDGKWIACASGGKSIHLWDTQTGDDHGAAFAEEGVEYVRWNRDGSRLLTGTSRNTLTLWDVATQRALLRAVKHDLNGLTPSSLAAPLLDAAGHRLVTFTREGGLVVHFADAPERREPLATSAPVRSAAMAPDESSMAIGMADGSIALHDGRRWQREFRVNAKMAEPIRVMSFSPDGTRLAVIAGARTLSLWDVSGPEVRRLGEPVTHDAYAYTLEWSADGKRVVTSSYGERSAIMFNGMTGLTEWIVRQPPGVMAASLRPDGSRLVTAGFDNAARIYSAQDGQPDGPPLLHAGYVSVARWSPDGRCIFTGSYDGTARVWRLSDPPAAPPDIANSQASPGGRFLARRDWKEGRLGTILVYDMADGRLVGRTGPGQCGGVSDNGLVMVWDGDAGFEVQAFDDRLSPRPVSTIAFPYRTMPIARRDAQLAPDGRHAIITGDLRRWEVFDTGQSPARLVGTCAHPANCTRSALSPDGRLFGTVSARPGREQGSCITVWELATAQVVSTFVTLQPVARLHFSPDGKLVACGGASRGFVGGTARVYRCADGEPVTAHLAHRDDVEALQFSPDGRYLATGSRDCVARVWDVATGRLAAPEMVHAHHVAHLSFAGDGRSLVTTTASSPELRVWNPTTGEAVTPPLRLSRGTWLSRFTEDGSALITAGDVFMRWPLTEEGRSHDDLVRDAEFLSGHRHDPLTGERAIPRDELQAMYQSRTQTTREKR